MKTLTISRALIVSSCVVIISIYFWAASAGGKSFAPTKPEWDHYSFLTQAFLAGQTSLLVKPPPQLLALPDPFDPVANLPYRLHDASLYKGKYYVYFGPTPVLTLFAPVKVLLHRDMPTALACALFASAGFILSCMLFFAIARVGGLRIPGWLSVATVVTLGLGQFAPFVLTRPSTYEAAIFSGYCFFMLGLHLLFRSMKSGSHWWPLLAGIAIALTPGCRPFYAAVALAIIGLYAAFLYFRKDKWNFLGGPEIYLFAAPIAVAGLALAWYNLARFGNPLEFGINYGLTDHGSVSVKLLAANLIPGFYYFLLSPPLFRASFPFINFIPGIYPWGRLSEAYRIEPIAGLIAATPIVLAAGLFPLLWAKRDIRVMVVMLFAAAVTMLSLISGIGWSIVRYSLDFAPALLVVSALTVALLLSRTKGVAHSALTVGVLLLVCYSVCIHTTSLLNKYTTASHPFVVSPRSSAAIRKLSNFLNGKVNGVSRGVRIYSRAEWNLQAKAHFPSNPPPGTELILAAGTGAGDNTLGVRYENGHQRFVFDRTGKESILGEKFSADAGVEYDINARFEPETRVLEVRMNGAKLLQATLDMLPVDPDGISAGWSSIRVARNIRAFSGKFKILRCDLTPDGNSVPVAFTDYYPYSRGVLIGELAGRDPLAVFERIVIIPDTERFREVIEPGAVVDFHVSGRRRVVEVRPVDGSLEVLIDQRVNPYADGWPRVISIVDQISRGS